jgi:hypothetical protein
MSWFRVDDGLSDHPKTIALLASEHGKGGLALWTLAGSWCSKQLTDGQVPATVVARLGGTVEEAEALVTAGFWRRTKTGYAFHGWDERNPSRAEVEGKREAAKERVAKYREKRAGNALQTRDGNALHAHSGNAGVTPPPTRPDPARPDPLKEEGAEAPDLGERLRELSGRYPADLLDEARAACALSRKSGRMAESVWLTTLERLATLPTHAVVEAMRVFVERHADGDKGEAYLVAVAKGKAKRPNGRSNGRLPAGTGEGWSDADLPVGTGPQRVVGYG